MKKRDRSMDGAAEVYAEARVGGSEDEGNDAGHETSGLKPRADTLEHVEVITAINGELKKQDEGNLRIGEIVDQVIGPAGRAGYGETLIASLAANPDLMCSAEHLRRCWHYYRLMRDHGAALSGEFPALKFGHIYQLSRLLQLADEFSAADVADAIRFVAKQAMDRGKNGKPAPIDALAKAVTTEIRSVRGRGVHEKADPGDVSVVAGEKEENGNALETAHVALSDSLGTIQEAAQRIAGSGQYIQACRLQTDVDRIAQAHCLILGHIVRHDPASLVIAMARKRVIALAGLVGLKVVGANASEKEVLP